MRLTNAGKQTKGWRVPVAMSAILTATIWGCTEEKSKKNNSITGCEDALCYATCDAESGDDFSESYWVLRSAYCQDDSNCACNYGCDNEACAEYCTDQEVYSGGSCDLFSCVCYGQGSPDAGDAGDAG